MNQRVRILYRDYDTQAGYISQDGIDVSLKVPANRGTTGISKTIENTMSSMIASIKSS